LGWKILCLHQLERAVYELMLEKLGVEEEISATTRTREELGRAFGFV
jgi:hypothetical protein